MLFGPYSCLSPASASPSLYRALPQTASYSGDPTHSHDQSFVLPKSSSTPQWPFEASEDSRHLTTLFRLRTCDTHRLLAPRTTNGHLLILRNKVLQEASSIRAFRSIPQQKPPATSLAARPIPHAVDWPRSRSPKQRGWSQEVVGSSLGWLDSETPKTWPKVGLLENPPMVRRGSMGFPVHGLLMIIDNPQSIQIYSVWPLAELLSFADIKGSYVWARQDRGGD